MILKSLLFFSLLILLTIQPSSSDEDDVITPPPQSSSSSLSSSPPSCNIGFRCDNLTANYPFWGAPQPESCGAHPEMKLTCNTNTNEEEEEEEEEEDEEEEKKEKEKEEEQHLSTTIDIKGVSYFVKNIDQTTKTIRVSRKDYESEICSPQYPNTTINLQVFNYSKEYQNVTFLYDCPVPDKAVPVTFQCLSGRYRTCSVLGGVHGPGACSDSVVIPFPRKLNWTAMTDPSDLIQVLREGFKLIWMVEGDCGGDGLACPPMSPAPERCARTVSSVSS